MSDRDCRWFRHPVTRVQRVPVPLDSWVVGTGSLTARLRDRCGAGFAVQVIDEGWRRPFRDESRRLRIHRRRLAWVREVLLCCDGAPRIFARSVIPAGSLRGRNAALRVLGNRPLGELLFSGAGTRRSAMEVAGLRPQDWLARRVRSVVGDRTGDLWARRVVHELRGRPLLVAEVFLPELVEHE